MNKKIHIVMSSDREVIVFRNNDEQIRIPRDKRGISAEDLYDLFDYNIGDEYEITKENSSNVDPSVLDFFVDLITEIAERLSSYQDNDSEDSIVPEDADLDELSLQEDSEQDDVIPTTLE